MSTYERPTILPQRSPGEYVATEYVGQGFRDVSGWWHATISDGAQARSFQPSHSTTAHDPSAFETPVQQQPSHQTAAAAQLYTPDEAELQAQQGIMSALYPTPNGPYTVPAVEGYQPGILHQGLYLPSGGDDPTSLTSVPMPVAVQMSAHDPSIYQTPSYDYTHQPTPDLTPMQSVQSMQSLQSLQYTPVTPQHHSSPLDTTPAPAHVHGNLRPAHPRANSAPNRKMSMSMSTSTSTANGTSDTDVTPRSTETTVNVSVPEKEKFASNMNVMYSATPPDPVDRLTERLGEFLLVPSDSPPLASPTHVVAAGETGRKRKGRGEASNGHRGVLIPAGFESDGLTETTRNAL